MSRKDDNEAVRKIERKDESDFRLVDYIMATSENLGFSPTVYPIFDGSARKTVGLIFQADDNTNSRFNTLASVRRIPDLTTRFARVNIPVSAAY